MLEDKQKTASESNNPGVWVCHKCGWTYPNPHPSAKHRRNHKKHCGKIGNSQTDVSPRDRSSSPEPDDDLHEEEHNFSAKPVVDAVESNGTHDQVVEKGAITEVQEISNRVEEEEFADAVTDFSEASQSPNNELVQVGRNGHRNSGNRSVSGSLFHGHESVAFQTDHGDTSTEGHVGPTSWIGFDSVEASSLQIDSTESIKVERHEEYVDFMGKPVHSVQHCVGLRQDGLACILEQDSPIKEASNTISSDASVCILNQKDDGHVTQQQSDHLLGVEVELPEVKVSSSDILACSTTNSKEPKGTSSSNSSFSGTADVDTENGPTKNTIAKICEHAKGCRENEIEIEMSHQYREETNESRSFLGYSFEKVVMPICLVASTEIDNSLKVDVVLSDAPSTKICSEREAQDVAPVMKTSPEERSLSETSGSMTIITGDLNASLLESQVADKSVLIDSDTMKPVTGNCQGYGTRTCDQEKGKDDDMLVSMVPTNQPPGHIDNIISDVLEDLNLVKPVVPAVRTVNVESQKATGDDSNCQENMGESIPHVTLAPLTSINPGTFLKDSSGGHEYLTNQEASLGPPAIEALTDMADNSEVGVAYSNTPHTACCSPTEKKDFAPAEDTKAVDALDSGQDLQIRILSNVQEGKGNSLGCASSIYNTVTICDETILEHRNTCVGHRESPRMATLPKDKLGNDDSESGCNEHVVHSGGLSNFSTVTPENATQIAEPLVQLVIHAAPDDQTPIMESATEVELIDPYKLDYEISNSKKQHDLYNRDISVAAAIGVLASSEVQVEIVHANSIEKEVIWDNSKVGSSVESKTEITNRITDFNEQEFSKEHSSSMSRPFDVSSSSTSNILHVAPSIHFDIGPMECDMPSAVTKDEVTKIRNVVTSEDEKTCYSEKNILLAYGEQSDQILDLKRSTEKHVVSSMVYAPAEREHKEVQTPYVPRIGEQHHLEFQPNQNHYESLDSTGPDMTVHVAEENFSQEHLAEGCSPSSDNRLDYSITKDNVKELINLDSADGVLVKEQKFLPITDDAKVVERKDIPIPTGDANSSSPDEKTVVVCEELDGQSKDFKGSTNKHVEISSLVLAPVERELMEDQLPSDTQYQKKHHEKIGPNENHLDESDNRIKINQIAAYISNDEETSSAYLTTSSGPTVVSPLEQCILKEPRQDMVDLDSFDSTKIKDQHSKVDVTTAKSYVKTSASGEDDAHASGCQMDKIEDGDNFPTGNVVSPPDLVKAQAGNQGAEKASSSDSLKINVVSEAHQNSYYGADIFEPPSFMTLVEACGYHNETIKPPEMKPEYAVDKPTSSATEAVWFPSLPSVINDSEARKKNEESITKAVNSKRARTPLKNHLVENTEKGGTKLEDLKATPKGDVKSGSGTIGMKTNTEVKAPELESDNVCSSKFKLDASAITASTGISSPSKLFGNKKDKQKNRGRHSWIYVCCSAIN